MTQSVPSSNTYSYEPLPVFHSFRTLELFAGGPSDLLRGRLHAHYNHPSVSYEIVSYTWGNATLTHSIYIGDSVMPITTNLHSALVRLRYSDKPRVLQLRKRQAGTPHGNILSVRRASDSLPRGGI